MYRAFHNVHDLLCSSSDWTQCLLNRLEQIKGDKELSDRAELAFELAEAFEHCVPDRSYAIASYVLCYSADKSRTEVLRRARHLSIEKADFASAARLCRVEYKGEPQPELLQQEGIAWLDADQPDRSITPLLDARKFFSDSEEIQRALVCARQEWPDVRAEISRLKKEAIDASASKDAARALLQAARTMRMLNCSPSVIDKYLLTAFRADPEERSTLGLLERRLADIEYPDAFWAICEERIESREEPLAKVEELRRMATRLCLCKPYRNKGLQIAHRALSCAYDNQLQHIPGHVALHALLSEYCEQAQLSIEYLSLIERGLCLPLPELDHLFLSLQGLALTRRLGDEAGADNFAKMVRRFAPQHPLLTQTKDLRLSDDQGDGAMATIAWKTSDALRPGISVAERNEKSAENFELMEEIRPGWRSEGRHPNAPPIELPEAPEELSSSHQIPHHADVNVAPGPQKWGEITTQSSSSIDALKNTAKERNSLPLSREARADRLQIPLAIDFQVEGIVARALTRDLSESGAFIVSSQRLSLGQKLPINIHLPIRKDSLQTRVFLVEANILRSIGNGYGVEFVEPSEIFLEHFRLLLEEEADLDAR